MTEQIENLTHRRKIDAMGLAGNAIQGIAAGNLHSARANLIDARDVVERLIKVERELEDENDAND